MKQPLNDTLSLSREEMRALGYRVIDMLVEHFETLPHQRVPNIAKRADLASVIEEPLPEEGMPAEAALEHFQEAVYPYFSRVAHPRFFAYIPSPNNYISVMAEALMAGYNCFAGTWVGGSGPAALEQATVDWLRQLCGMPQTAGGLFVSGGSMANLMALAVARHDRLANSVAGARLYASDQTHSAIERGLTTLGFEADQLRKLHTDDRYRLDLDALHEAIQEDRAAGWRPFCVVANAGTTNTGAVDPLAALSAYCRAEGLWLHVDGAYGAAAVLCERGRALLDGLGEADSLALDPHKWLFQPYETGCLLVRDQRLMRQTFHVQPEYMKDTERPAGDEINFCEYGLQLTRNLRALKLWLSFKVFGVAAFRAAIERGFVLAEVAEQRIRSQPGWEVVSPATMGIVAFRYAPAGYPAARLDDLNQRIVAALMADGFAMISTTRLRGTNALRLCPISPRTTEADVLATLDKLHAFGRQLAGVG